jgi:predicted enzyme related to lactoylglutathione lyase
MSTKPLLQAVDAVTIAVPDLEAGLSFYRDRLGHQLRWRNDAIGQAGLALPGSNTEIVLTTELDYEPDWLVESADQAAAAVQKAGGRVVVEPFDIPVGRVTVVTDPFGNRLVLLDLSKGSLPDGRRRERHRGGSLTLVRLLAKQLVVHFESLSRAVGRDDDAVGRQQRVIVDDRDTGLGEADPVAEQRGAGFRPGQVAGVVRAECRWADGLVSAGDGKPAIGQDGVQPTLIQALRIHDGGELGWQVRSLDDQRATGEEPQAAQPEHFALGTQAGSNVGGRQHGVRGEHPCGDLGALVAEIGGEAAQMTEVIGVSGGHVGAASVPGLDQALIGEQLQGLAQGHDADPELAGELVLGWQRAARWPPAIADAGPQLVVNAQVFGLPVVGVPPQRGRRDMPSR